LPGLRAPPGLSAPIGRRRGRDVMRDFIGTSWAATPLAAPAELTVTARRAPARDGEPSPLSTAAAHAHPAPARRIDGTTARPQRSTAQRGQQLSPAHSGQRSGQAVLVPGRLRPRDAGLHPEVAARQPDFKRDAEKQCRWQRRSLFWPAGAGGPGAQLDLYRLGSGMVRRPPLRWAGAATGGKNLAVARHRASRDIGEVSKLAGAGGGRRPRPIAIRKRHPHERQ